MSKPTDSGNGLEINGVAHVIFRVNRIAECIAFYDQLMPFLGLRAVQPRSDDFVYYVGGRTALAIRRAAPEHAGAAHVETAPGIDHLCFRARRRKDVDTLYSFLQGIGADIVRAPEEGPWAPGYYSLSFRDPEGIRLELNHVPGKGVFAEGAAFDPAPDYPLSGQPRPKD
jgi:catechol 2,3-dioxygenase-like lactoylglutathione lyase family enzyme